MYSSCYIGTGSAQVFFNPQVLSDGLVPKKETISPNI